MKTQFLAASLAIVLLSVLACGSARGDALAGFSDITVVNDAIVSLRYAGNEYVVANGDLIVGTTTRWYIPASTGIPTLWAEGDPAPAATNSFGSPPKPEDPGSEADNFFFRLNGANNMSSLDAIDFQETIFPVLTDTIFVFERGGNDNGTYQAILADGSLGPAVPFKGASDYASTGVNVAGQNAFGVVFTTNVRVKGVRITAPGHDCLSISAIPKPFDPKQSHDPQPADGATDVSRDVVMSWTPGEDALAVNGHTVYFSKDLNNVNNGIGGVRQSPSTFDPGRLDFGATYYWRVDEVSATATYKGNTWSFTTEPVAYPIPVGSVAATASSNDSNKGPENTVNGSGLDASGLLHGNAGETMWLSSRIGAQPTWIQFEFDRVYKLHEMWVWNSNESLETVIGFGLKDVTMEYSLDGTNYTTLGTTHQFAQAPSTPDYAHNTTVDLEGITAKYIRLTPNSNWGGLVTQYGLSEVRFFYVPVNARGPSPASGAAGVDPGVTLTWRAGREAVAHEVYLSTDRQAVADGSVPLNRVTDPSYDPTLELGRTYYWRVDEVNEAQTPAIWKGDLWNFSTPQYLVVDDFESYNDIDPPGADSHRIFESWIDGYGVATNGALVGNDLPPYAEQTIVHGGRQSMPLFYSNTSGAAYSEATRTFAAPQDWTQYGIQTLGIWFQGVAGNTGQLYIKINGSKISYNGQASDLAQAGWQNWNIDLAASGVNLKSVRSLTIGIEGIGAAGTLYVDDIQLHRAPVAVLIKIAPASSFTATGDNGTIVSINGISVDALVLGTTTFSGTPASAQFPPQDADNFDLSIGASADNQAYVQTLFAVPVTTIFLIEKGGNDSGFIQALDQNGLAVGEMIPFSPADFTNTGLKGVQNQAVAAAVITAAEPIYGIRMLPPAGGTLQVDPTCVCAVPAK